MSSTIICEVSVVSASRVMPPSATRRQWHTLSSPTGPRELLTTLAMVCAARTGSSSSAEDGRGVSDREHAASGTGRKSTALRRTILIADLGARDAVAAEEKTWSEGGSRGRGRRVGDASGRSADVEAVSEACRFADLTALGDAPARGSRWNMPAMTGGAALLGGVGWRGW